MRLKYLLFFALTLIITNIGFAQEADKRKASKLGDSLLITNEEDSKFFGNWQIIPSKSDTTIISLMPKQDCPTGEYLIIKPTNKYSAISSYVEGENHSVDLGFKVYRKGNDFYANLITSVAMMFKMEYKGYLIEFKCEYLKEEDQLKLTTSDNVVFYLKRF